MFNHNHVLIILAAIISCIHLLVALASAVLSINNLSIDYANAQSISAPPTGHAVNTSGIPIMPAIRRFIIANASN